jgi:dolichyl-phosphate beta-glucosyltransferase
MKDLSIVIPAYNEEKRLSSTLESVYAYLTSRQIDFELIVVDDGSRDGTVEIVQEFAKHHDSVRLLSYSPNQGKGYAVRQGVLKSSGARVLFNDADGSSPIQEIEKLEASLNSGFDIAIASRAKPDSSRKVNALAYRKFIGNFFNFIVQTLLLKGIQDSQCGFKLFTRKAADAVFGVARENGFAFDVELLHVARLHGLRIEEVPINWTNVDGSKVNLVLDSSKMFVDVLKIKLRSIIGLYKAVTFKPYEKKTPKQVNQKIERKQNIEPIDPIENIENIGTSANINQQNKELSIPSSQPR